MNCWRPVAVFVEPELTKSANHEVDIKLNLQSGAVQSALLHHYQHQPFYALFSGDSNQDLLTHNGLWPNKNWIFTSWASLLCLQGNLLQTLAARIWYGEVIWLVCWYSVNNCGLMVWLHFWSKWCALCVSCSGLGTIICLEWVSWHHCHKCSVVPVHEEYILILCIQRGN